MLHIDDFSTKYMGKCSFLPKHQNSIGVVVLLLSFYYSSSLQVLEEVLHVVDAVHTYISLMLYNHVKRIATTPKYLCISSNNSHNHNKGEKMITRCLLTGGKNSWREAGINLFKLDKMVLGSGGHAPYN